MMLHRCALLASLLVWIAPAGTRAADNQAPTPEDLPAIDPGPAVSLDEALRLADERNLSLAAARADILEAQAGLKSSWALLIPTADVTMSFTHNDHADTVQMATGQTIEVRKQQNLSGSLVVAAPLVNARLWQGIVQADLGVDVAELSVEQTRQTLLLSTAQAYYQALAARSLVQVQENQIASSQRHLAVATIRHRSGTGSRLDVVRAQTELLTARESLLGAHQALDDARDALSVLIGMEDTLPMPTEVPELDAPDRPAERLVQEALAQREDLRLARAMVELADSQLTGSWMQFIPSLSGAWQLNQQMTELSDFGSQDKSRWFIGLTLSVPIFDEVRYADLDAKRAALHRAELDAAWAELNAGLEVRKAKRAWQTAVEQVATAQRKARLSAESLRLAETAYENGTGSSLEVTDARRQSRLADIDLAVKRFDAQLALLTLLRATGEDMRALAHNAPPQP